MKNHNRLLRTLEGAIGVKTGFTKAAGRCLVSCVERQGRSFIAVTLGVSDDWKVHEGLYETAFGGLQEYILAEAGTLAATVPIAGGGAVNVVFADDIRLWLTPEEHETVQIKLNLPDFAYADELEKITGAAEVYVRGALYATAELAGKPM